MYGLKVYITPEDILDKLSYDDKERFNNCVFTDVIKEADGSIEITCLLFDDKTITKEPNRHRLSNEELELQF